MGKYKSTKEIYNSPLDKKRSLCYTVWYNAMIGNKYVF